jgi:predicted dehydrogenase
LIKENIALIGIGYWGKVYFKYLKNRKDLSLKYIIYKKNKLILKNKTFQNYNVTNNIDILLNDRFTKYACLVTPIDTHSKLAIKLLHKNKKILVEKPLLMNAKEEKKIIKYKKNITVSYPYLFSKSLIKAKQIIKKRILGEISFVEINFQQCGRFNKFDVYKLLSPHTISILSIFYDIQKVKFNTKKIIMNNQKTESAIIDCYIKKQLICVMNLSLNYANNEPKKEINVYCKKGNILCDFKSTKNNFRIFKYSKNKINGDNIVKIKKILQSSINEKENMKDVLKDFVSNKNINNFNLTKKINNFLK